MAELAREMVMDRTTLVRALQPMLRRGLVTAPAEEHGNGRLRLILTASGAAKLEQAAVHWAAAQASFERSFGQQQAAHLRDELFRMTSDVLDR